MQDKPNNDSSHGAELTVTVLNELNTKKEQFQAGPGTPVSTIVDRMYASPKLGIGSRSSNDRLLCGQDNVLTHTSMHLEDYKDQFCGRLQWVFTGPTGGA
jgi:hypothetical protein